MAKAVLLVLLTLLVLVVGLVLIGSVLAGLVREPYKGYDAAEQFVDIPAGSSTNDIGRRLVEARVVRNLLLFRVATWTNPGGGRTLKAGEYRFTAAMSAMDVVEKIAKGDVHVRRVTFPEGLNILEMARIYETRGLGPASAFVKAASDASAIRDLDPEARDLEGYLYPETYAMPRGAAAATR